jgi:hypothetical protein
MIGLAAHLAADAFCLCGCGFVQKLNIATRSECHDVLDYRMLSQFIG